MKYVEIKLTKDQADKLADCLHDHQDEGPSGYGWASKELSELRGIVDSAIDEYGAA